jgi:hypothetical protein
VSLTELTNLRILQNLRLSDKLYALTSSNEHPLLLSEFGLDSLSEQQLILRDRHTPINSHEYSELLSERLDPERMMKRGSIEMETRVIDQLPIVTVTTAEPVVAVTFART